MRTDMKKIFNLKHFFNVVKSTNSCINYNLTKPSCILINNIHRNWLQYIYSKIHKQMPIYLNSSANILESTQRTFGCIEQNITECNEQTIFEHNFQNSSLRSKSELKLDLIVPQDEAMQYFTKWQRYRKYWWSSISTTPSLFSVHDIKYEAKSANVDIVAQLTDGLQPVENIIVNFEKDDKSQLSCSLSLNDALNILLLDALDNNSREEYLRLHRKITPYKIGFGLKAKGCIIERLKELASLLYYKLESNKISAWLPEFNLPYNLQIKENLHLGVTYTAVLSEDTLDNGIFRLINSSTMLGEQVHVSDFHDYAALLFD